MRTIVVAALLLLVPVSASADWQKTKWGMTEAQVKKAYPSLTEAGDAALSMPYSALGSDFTAVLKFRDGKLDSVKLHHAGEVRDLEYQLRLKYGEPISADMMGVIWETPTDRITVFRLGDADVEYRARASADNNGL